MSVRAATGPLHEDEVLEGIRRWLPIEIPTYDASVLEGRGFATALLDRAELEARERGAKRLFLTTSNDNLAAIRFYQRRGMKMVKVHAGMMDRYRTEGQPVPLIGMNGIPLRDELELEVSLEHSHD